MVKKSKRKRKVKVVVPKKKKMVSKKPMAKIKRERAIRFSSQKLDLMRQTIVSVLWSNEEITRAKMKAETSKILDSQFKEEFDLYFEKMVTLLTTNKLIEEAKTGKTLNLRLIQKLE